MHKALADLFDAQVEFRLVDGTPIGGSVYVGEVEFLALETLREDPEAYRSECERWFDQVWLREQAERRQQLLAIPGNADRFADLRGAVERQQAIPLIGSGMSVPCGLPTWSDLLRRIRTYTRVDSEALEALITSSRFEEAADLLASATTPNLLGERIEHDLRIRDEDAIEGPVGLLPIIFSSLVITTNLDDILEMHYEQTGVNFTHVFAGLEIARYRQLKNPTESFLLKLHGDRRRAESRVLLSAEYEAAYREGSAVREEVALLYRTHNVLFLGCSLGPDRSVTLFSEVARGDPNLPKHYAFLMLPESQERRLERELFLTERGIYPIWYDGSHEESISALLAGLPGNWTGETEGGNLVADRA